MGERIRELRGDIQQQDLAAFLGISQGQLSKIENGAVAPTVDVLLRLSERFGKTIGWIVQGKAK